MMLKELLAKSEYKDHATTVPAVSLLDHSKAVADAAKSVFSSIQDFLPPETDKDILRELVLIGALLHDLGKANNIFQKKIRKEIRRDRRQPMRHEILSALIVAGCKEECKPFSQWLEKEIFNHRENANHLVWMLSWTVGGHHLKLHHIADYETRSMVEIIGIPRGDIVFHGGDHIKSALDVLADIINTELNIKAQSPPLIPDFSIPTDPSEDSHVIMVENYIWESEAISEDLEPHERLLVAYAKAIVIAADIAGSALWSNKDAENVELEHAIENSLEKGFKASDVDKVINDRLGDTNKLHEFQRRTGNSTVLRTVLEASCGGGKTIAAYEWAKQHEGRKLIFCYPTTGTASAGYEDYLHAQSELERTLLHSRAGVDIARMRINGEGEDIPNKDSDAVSRVQSLRAWGQQVITCTVDRVLGLMQNQRTGLYSFPAILKSAIVFDEIHSYDTKLFGALLRFLEAFQGIPVLLMTASLSPNRREELKKIIGAFSPLEGNKAEESKKRYRLEKRESDTECWRDVSTALENGKKVLWVRNTVKDAKKIYQEATGHNLPVQPILFHSRYRYKDRINIQEKVLLAFKQEKPCLAITTQVCEMSLDISAGLLVSANAPFPAIVQRLGRLNRYYEHKENALCLVHPFKGKDRHPYLNSDLEDSDKITDKLSDSDNFSQWELRDFLEELTGDEDFKLHSAWLDDAWESGQATLREGGNSITVLRKEDEKDIRAECKNPAKPTAQEVMEWTIPMPPMPHASIHVSGALGGFPLIDKEFLDYDAITGGTWKKKSGRK